MAGHFLLSKDARDFTVEGVERMSEREVHKFFVESRWGKDGVQICPGCGTIDSHYWVKTRRQWRCKDIACGRSFSVTSDTKFADHKLPLKKLLKAFVIFANNVKGISASALARTIGVAYQTAFVLLHKLRESIMECWNEDQLDGLVHIDGAYVSGRIRKPRVKKKATETQHRDKKPQWQSSKHPNQRVVMVLREVDPEGNKGSIRTIVHVVRAEDSRTAEELAKIYIKRDAKVMTDEAPAYNSLIERYDHLTVNHSKEFSTDDGVSNNQAESFFARMRRMVIGQVHRVTPKYMLDYVTEVAWREDVRRTPTSRQVGMLANAASRSRSKWWCGYWQKKNRPEEILFVPTGSPPKPAPVSR